MTAIDSTVPHETGQGGLDRPGYVATVRLLAAAQKTAARSAPAYSRYVNRKLGRLLAAAAYLSGLSPNAVTAISGVFTFSGIVGLALFPPSWPLGFAVSACLVVGYALDSADGQVARLRGLGSAAGEWLDHVVDATKTSLLPLALAVGLYRSDAVEPVWLLVPLGAAVVCAVLFFSMILIEQLRKQNGTVPVAAAPGRSWLRSILVMPMDYGVLCLTFLVYGAVPLFMTVYTLIFVATAAFLVLASIKWFRELSSAPARESSGRRGRHALLPDGQPYLSALE